MGDRVPEQLGWSRNASRAAATPRDLRGAVETLPGEPGRHATRDRHMELYGDGAAVAQRRQMKMAVVSVSCA